MSLKIVTGGTTGAADGTLVSSSNKIVFTALDGVVDCHIRADDDTYSADASFTMPSDGAVQVSFDGGSTWKAFGTNPNSYGVDIGDLNVAIKLRQHSTAAASTGTFQTDATTPAATALGQVTGLTVTPNGSGQLDLSWTALANRTYYKIERATDSGFTTGLTTLSSTATATTYSSTGLTNGTTYYFRVTGIGTGRYKDGTASTGVSGTPSAIATLRADDFNHNAGSAITGTASTGTGSDGSTWTLDQSHSASSVDARITSSTARARPGGTVEQPFLTLGTTMSSADYDVQADIVGISDIGVSHDNYAGVVSRWVPAASPTPAYESKGYAFSFNPYTGAMAVVRYRPSSAGAPGTGALWTSTDAALIGNRTIALRVTGTGAVTLKAYVDGVLKQTITDNDTFQHTAPGRPGLVLRYGGAASDSNGVHVDNFKVGTLF